MLKQSGPSNTVVAPNAALGLLGLNAGEPEDESDEQLVQRIREGETSLFAILVRRYNQRLFRVAMAILRDEHEAEDVVQQTHVSAYLHLEQFAGRAKFSTWLVRIATHEALARVRKRAVHEPGLDGASTPHTPEEAVLRRELAHALESALRALPEAYRLAFVLRDVEGLGSSEAAACLGVSEENLRVRLHRARLALRDGMQGRMDGSAKEVFSFGGERCARVARYVFARLFPADSRLPQPSSAAQFTSAGSHSHARTDVSA